MKTFLLVVSIWGNNGTDWIYTGNQYVMQELYTQEKCMEIASDANWARVRSNPYYDLQFQCFDKDDTNG